MCENTSSEVFAYRWIVTMAGEALPNSGIDVSSLWSSLLRGQTQEDGLITRRSEGQGVLSEAHREQKSMCIIGSKQGSKGRNNSPCTREYDDVRTVLKEERKSGRAIWPVASCSPSPYKIFTGQVSEWCRVMMESPYYSKPPLHSQFPPL